LENDTASSQEVDPKSLASSPETLEKDAARTREESAKREAEKRDAETRVAEAREATKREALAAKAAEEESGPEVVDAPPSLASPQTAPPPSIVLTREAPPAELKPEDVPLVDEASGIEGARYAIQCGSYRDRDRALEVVARVAASTGERARLLPMEMSSGTWYRVLLGDFDSEPAARAKIGNVHEHDRLLVLQVVRLSGPGGSGS
jgi:cell division protein FtsN